METLRSTSRPRTARRQVTLETWAAVHEPAVDALVASHPEGLVYYTPAFRRYLLAVAGGECRSRLAFQDGQLTGVMPVLALAGPYGTVLNSLPLFGSYGGILSTTSAAEAAF